METSSEEKEESRKIWNGEGGRRQVRRVERERELEERESVCVN